MPAVRERTGEFEQYDIVELVGFDTCGGCARGKPKKILERGLRLKEKGAEVIHLSNCLMVCPFKDKFKAALEEEVGLPVVEFTHWHPPEPREEWR